MGSNPATTTTGIAAAGTATVALITMLLSGHIDIQPAITDVGVIFAGLTGLFAKDASK